MLYDYIITNYQKDEPIFLAELPGKSRESVRQEMKKLTDEGKIERLYNGVYYRSYKTILGTKGKVSVDKFIQKRYLEANGEIFGYITGIQLANMYGFTTQNLTFRKLITRYLRKAKTNGRRTLRRTERHTTRGNRGRMKAFTMIWAHVTHINCGFRTVKAQSTARIRTSTRTPLNIVIL